MESRPARTIGLLAGFIIGLTLIVIDLILIQTVRDQPVDMNLFLTAVLLILTLPLLAVWLYGILQIVTLRYHVDRNAVTISTLFFRQTIPHRVIREIRTGRDLDAEDSFHGLNWPGFLRGTVATHQYGPLAIYSTEPLDRQIILVTNTGGYGISPHDPEGFWAGIGARRALGPSQELNEHLEYRHLAAWPVWRDRSFWAAVLLTLVINLALAGYIVGHYQNLPGIIPLHWDAQGQVDRIATKSWVFSVPAIGILALGLNVLSGVVMHARERFGALFLAWSGVAVQATLWLAVVGLLRL